HDLGARVHGEVVQAVGGQVGGQPAEGGPQPVRGVIRVVVVLVGQGGGVADPLVVRPAAHGDGVGRRLRAVVQAGEEVAVGVDQGRDHCGHHKTQIPSTKPQNGSWG